MSKDLCKNEKIKSEVKFNEYDISLNSQSTDNKRSKIKIDSESSEKGHFPFDQVKEIKSPKFNEEVVVFRKAESVKTKRSIASNGNISNNDNKNSEFTFNNKEMSNLFTYSNEGEVNSNNTYNTLNTVLTNEVMHNRTHFSNKGENHFFVNLNLQNLVIMDNEIQGATKLILQDEEGEILWNKLLIIDASGLQTGLRKKRDGFTFFGSVANYVS